MNTELDAFLTPFSPDVRDLARRARALVVATFPDAIEQIDPSARLIGYGFDRPYKGLVCGITLQRSYVNLMFARGAELPDPAGLLTGTGKRARHVKIQRLDDLASPELAALLEAAVTHGRNVSGHPPIARPIHHVRAGWDEQFNRMAATGDDRLPDPDSRSLTQ
jgi:hypothetical protein